MKTIWKTTLFALLPLIIPAQEFFFEYSSYEIYKMSPVNNSRAGGFLTLHKSASNYQLVKTDYSGNYLWGSGPFQNAHYVLTENAVSDEIAVAGITSSGDQSIVAFFTGNGTLVDTRLYDINGLTYNNFVLKGVLATSDGGYLLYGQDEVGTAGEAPLKANAYVIKINSYHQIVWSRKCSYSAEFDDDKVVITDAVETEDYYTLAFLAERNNGTGSSRNIEELNKATGTTAGNNGYFLNPGISYFQQYLSRGMAYVPGRGYVYPMGGNIVYINETTLMVDNIYTDDDFEIIDVAAVNSFQFGGYEFAMIGYDVNSKEVQVRMGVYNHNIFTSHNVGSINLFDLKVALETAEIGIEYSPCANEVIYNFPDHTNTPGYFVGGLSYIDNACHPGYSVTCNSGPDHITVNTTTFFAASSFRSALDYPYVMYIPFSIFNSCPNGDIACGFLEEKGRWAGASAAAQSGNLGFSSATASMEVFPNPALGQFTVSTTLKSVEELRVFNATGAMVYQSEWTSEQRELQVDMHDLPAGIYSVQLVSPEEVKEQTVILK